MRVMGKKGGKTRQHIIDKSLMLFCVRGYFNTSINNILEETGLTKGGVYAHFNSKEEIWNAAYKEATAIWKKIIFTGLRSVKDPLERIIILIEHDMRDYIGANTLPCGCFFLNTLVEFSGQSKEMADFVWNGFEDVMRILESWIEEANNLKMLKPELDSKEISRFIVITLNGTAALYAATKDQALWLSAINQLKYYINQLRKTN